MAPRDEATDLMSDLKFVIKDANEEPAEDPGTGEVGGTDNHDGVLAEENYPTQNDAPAPLVELRDLTLEFNGQTILDCGNQTYACGDLEDNDGDGFIDLFVLTDF